MRKMSPCQPECIGEAASGGLWCVSACLGRDCCCLYGGLTAQGNRDTPAPAQAARLDPLATMAYAHVSSTIPNFYMLEWTHYANKNMTSLTEPVPMQDGYLVPSDKPGIGVALNDDAVRERTETGFKTL